MAGKLMFKLTGGKTDKDEEYEQLKDEFLKYKKVCAPASPLAPLPLHFCRAFFQRSFVGL